MTIEEVFNYFDGNWTQAMIKLRFSPQTYQYWLKIGKISIRSQLKIQRLTLGYLRADEIRLVEKPSSKI